MVIPVFNLLSRHLSAVLCFALLLLTLSPFVHTGSLQCVAAKNVSGVLETGALTSLVQSTIGMRKPIVQLVDSRAAIAVPVKDLGHSLSDNLRLADVFQDHMVLQRGQCILVWGTGKPNSKVIVRLNKQAAIGYCNSRGEFKLSLKPELAGGPYRLLVQCQPTSVSVNVPRTAVAAGTKSGAIYEIAYNDVMVGEVWLCAGQSNMDMAVNKSADKAVLLSNLSDQLRLFAVGKAQAFVPSKHLQGRWQIADAACAGEFSAVALSFGRRLQSDLKVPVGIIVASMPAAPIDAWMPERMLQQEPPFDKIYAERRATEYASKFNSKKCVGGAVSGTTGGGLVAAPLLSGRGCSTLYNAMVAPLIPYAIKGVLWYQGEGNLGGHGDYRRHFPALIDAWRVAWHQTPQDFAFIYVQLPGCKLFVDQLGDGVWAQMRKAQDNALRLCNTYRVSAIDLGAPDQLHPLRKDELGRRASAVALNNVYGRAQIELAPEALKYTVLKNRVLIEFCNTGGLLRLTGGDCFALCGSDGVYHQARVSIENNLVTLWSERVPEPLEVRYAWADAPGSLLVNVWNVPAAPFSKLF